MVDAYPEEVIWPPKDVFSAGAAEDVVFLRLCCRDRVTHLF